MSLFLEIWLLLPGLADLAANLLSANPLPRSIYSYHSATLVPIFMVSAMYGLRRCSVISRKRLVHNITLVCFFVSLFLGYCFSYFYPLPGVFNSWNPKSITPFNDPVISEVKKIVGFRSASVQANLGAHFSQRMEIYPFPYKIGQVDMIVLYLHSPTTLNQGHNPEVVGTLAHHLQMSPQFYLETIENLLNDERYGIVLWKESWLIFQKNAYYDIDIKNIELHLETLANEWK